MSMTCTVRDVYAMIDSFAPFASAMMGDNVGLLVGKKDRPVDTILTALDATPQVVQEASKLGAQLLITHHPIMFSPRNCLDEEDPDAALISDMIRAGVSMIAAHTNLDIAHGGVNDVLAERIGWPVVEVQEFLRIGGWETPQTLEDLQLAVSQALHTQVIRYGKEDAKISRFAICSGSGGSEVKNARDAGADVLLTGEIKHGQALDAMARGLNVLAAGHRATEVCAADLLSKHLQSSLDEVELKVRVFVSQIDPFA